ncbi:MAG TPA: hypothetical protein VEI26_00845 [Terriglobales bacterium]|nr:hypothetical protein [Terriglobales bacterium]
MGRNHLLSVGALLWLSLALPAFCQVIHATSADSVVPPVVNFSGAVFDSNGKPRTDLVGITFYLYAESEGGAPLWMETQNVQPDRTGHYSVVLGSSKSTGLPPDIFASGAARWLSVQVEGQEEQPRILLLSVPYALKAKDAETLGGRPASAFLLAPSPQASSANEQPTRKNSSTVQKSTALNVTGKGSANYLPLWTSSSNLGISELFQTSGRVGVGTVAPGAKLDILTFNPIATRSIAETTNGIAMYGVSTASSGTGTGLIAETDSANGTAVILNNAAGGNVLSAQVKGHNFLAIGPDTEVDAPPDRFGNVNLSGNIVVTGVVSSVGIGDTLGTDGVIDVNSLIPGVASGSDDYGVIGGGVTGGMLAESEIGDGIDASAPNTYGGLAGNFTGDVNISGHLSKSSGSFKIDHPQDPANKYLYHSFVESPDMMNIYNGNAVLDDKGEAEIMLPDWFRAQSRFPLSAYLHRCSGKSVHR